MKKLQMSYIKYLTFCQQRLVFAFSILWWGNRETPPPPPAKIKNSRLEERRETGKQALTSLADACDERHKY